MEDPRRWIGGGIGSRLRAGLGRVLVRASVPLIVIEKTAVRVALPPMTKTLVSLTIVCPATHQISILTF